MANDTETSETSKQTPKTAISSVYHPALNVTNIRNLVPLILDVEKAQYNFWATLFRNTARAYNVLDHIDAKIKWPADVDDELWLRLDAIVLQWLYGTISTDLLYTILDENATALVAVITFRITKAPGQCILKTNLVPPNWILSPLWQLTVKPLSPMLTNFQVLVIQSPMNDLSCN